MMEKRDLKADLEHCERFGKLVEMGWYKLEAPYTVESVREILDFAPAASEGWPHAIERAIEAEAKLEKAKGLIQRWFDGEISAFGVMDSMIIDLEFDIDGIPDEALEYHNIKRKEVLGDD